MQSVGSHDVFKLQLTGQENKRKKPEKKNGSLAVANRIRTFPIKTFRLTNKALRVFDFAYFVNNVQKQRQNVEAGLIKQTY